MSDVPFDLEGAVAAALHKVDAIMRDFPDLYPHANTERNVYPLNHERNTPLGANAGWTTSFVPGMYWLAWELSGDERYRRAAEAHVPRFAQRLASRMDVDHHDLGFLYSLACVVPWRLTGNSPARQIALDAADALMTRFWDKPSVFQAWGRMDDPAQRGRTIVDSLMNMPLLYWATRESGNPRYAEAATRAVRQVQRFLVRPDAGTIHTYYFDADTGAPLYGKTHQGAADDSVWAEGQAFALYGFVLAWVYTGERELLETARRVADRFVSMLPADRVAYWDLWYGDGSGEPRDSSASAIAVCGMLEYSRQSPTDEALYRVEALDELRSLYERYSTRDVPGSNALLLHGSYNKPSGRGVDEANLWGDYFYLEALTRVAKPGWKLYW